MTLCPQPALDGFTVDKLEARLVRFKKNLGVGAKLLSRDGGQAWMLTFTYRDDCPWEPSQIRAALDHLRKYFKRAYGWSLRYVWVIESKKRLTGAHVGRFVPHYHVVVWVPVQVRADELRCDDLGYWPHGMTNAVKAVAPVKYIMKYASKFDGPEGFPKGARCYGMGGLPDSDRRIRRWINWPSFVQARASVACDFARRVGGGWINRCTGEWWPSEFGLVWTTPKQTAVVRVHDHGRPLGDVRGPYSWLPGMALP